MNDILCQKCNAKQSKINLEFSTFYKCQICENTCCINCMYLCCSICNKEIICFWCGTDFKHINNITLKFTRIQHKPILNILKSKL